MYKLFTRLAECLTALALSGIDSQPVGVRHDLLAT